MMTLPTLDYSNLLNREHLLAQGLLAKWMVLPGQFGGTRWYDIVTGRVGTLTNMALPGTSTSGWGTATYTKDLGEMRFDGVNDFATLARPREMTVAAGQGTVSLWAKFNGTPALLNCFNLNTGTNSILIAYWTGAANKGMLCQLFGAADDGTRTSQLASDPDITKWHMWTFTWSNLSIRADIYVDGIKLSTAGGAGLAPNNVDALEISRGLGGGYQSAMFATDICIYDHPLAPRETLALYAESALGNPTLLNWEETELDQPSVFYSIPAVVVGIQPDAASNSGIQTAQSTYTFNRTCTGTDRYLDISVALLSAGQTVSSVVDDYGGGAVNAVFVGAQTTVTSFGRVEMWRVVAPATGTKSIQVNLSGSSTSVAMATSYTGVHQTSPTEAFNSAQATNVGAADATVTVTSIADNCWIIAALATDDGSVTPNQTSRSNVSGGATLSGVVEDTGPKTPAGGQAMSVTDIGALATWAIAGYAIRPIAASNFGVVGPFVDGRLVKRGILQGRLIL